MNFNEALQDDVENIYGAGEWSVAATYTPVTGTAKAITVIPDYGAQVDNLGWQAGDGRYAEFYLQASDVAAPAVNDVITVGAVRWALNGLISGDGLVWRVGAINHS